MAGVTRELLRLPTGSQATDAGDRPKEHEYRIFPVILFRNSPKRTRPDCLSSIICLPGTQSLAYLVKDKKSFEPNMCEYEKTQGNGLLEDPNMKFILVFSPIFCSVLSSNF